MADGRWQKRKVEKYDIYREKTIKLKKKKKKKKKNSPTSQNIRKQTNIIQKPIIISETIP